MCCFKEKKCFFLARAPLKIARSHHSGKRSNSRTLHLGRSHHPIGKCQVTCVLKRAKSTNSALANKATTIQHGGA